MNYSIAKNVVTITEGDITVKIKSNISLKRLPSVMDDIDKILQTDTVINWYIHQLLRFSKDKINIDSIFLEYIFIIVDSYVNLIDINSLLKDFDPSGATEKTLVFNIEETKQTIFLSCVLKLLSPILESDIIPSDDSGTFVLDYIKDKRGLAPLITKIFKFVNNAIMRVTKISPSVKKAIICSREDIYSYIYDYVLSVSLVTYDMSRNPFTYIMVGARDESMFFIRRMLTDSGIYMPAMELDELKVFNEDMPLYIESEVVFSYVESKVKIVMEKDNLKFADMEVDDYIYKFLIIPIYHNIFNLNELKRTYTSYQLKVIQIFIMLAMKTYKNTSSFFISPYFINFLTYAMPYGGDEDNTVMALEGPVKECFIDDSFCTEDDYSNTDFCMKDNDISDSPWSQNTLDIVSCNNSFYGINNRKLLIGYLKCLTDKIFSGNLSGIFDVNDKRYLRVKNKEELEKDIYALIAIIFGNVEKTWTEFKDFVRVQYRLGA